MSSGTRSVLGRMFTPVRLDDPTPTSLARGGVLAVSGLLAQGILRFATAWLVGHVAGQAQLGIVASGIAVATIIALMWPTSAGSAASKFVARARGEGSIEEARSTLAHLSRRIGTAVLLLAAAAVPIWVFVDRGSILGGLAVAAMTIGYSGYSFTRGIQFGAGQSARAACWDILCVVIGLGALSLFMVIGVRGVALVLPLALGYGIYALAGWPFEGRGRPSRQRRRELDAFVALGAVATLSSSGFLQLSQVVARLASGESGAGEYAAALALATPASMLSVSLTLVLLPALAETLGRSDTTEFRARTDRATRSLTAVVVLLFGSIALTSRILVQLIWGDSYAGAEPLLTILAVAVLFTNLGVVPVNALMARSQRGMWINVAAGLIGMTSGVTFWSIAAPSLGGLGVALGYLLGTSVIATIQVVVVWRTGEHRWSMLYARVAAALALLAAGAWVQHTLDYSILVDLTMVTGFGLFWGLINRSELSRLPIGRGGRP